MTEYDFGYDREQEAILAKTPLLKAFLDESINIDPTLWAQTFMYELTPVLLDMQNKFGENNLLTLGIWPQINHGVTAGVLSSNLDFEGKMSSVAMVQAIGYSIGSLHEAGRFTGNVMIRLVQMKTINEPSDEEQTKEALSIVWDLLGMGAFWKTASSDKEDLRNLSETQKVETKHVETMPPPKNVELPPEIDNFLDSLLKPKDPPEENK